MFLAWGLDIELKPLLFPKAAVDTFGPEYPATDDTWRWFPGVIQQAAIGASREVASGKRAFREGIWRRRPTTFPGVSLLAVPGLARNRR